MSQPMLMRFGTTYCYCGELFQIICLVTVRSWHLYTLARTLPVLCKHLFAIGSKMSMQKYTPCWDVSAWFVWLGTNVITDIGAHRVLDSGCLAWYSGVRIDLMQSYG